MQKTRSVTLAFALTAVTAGICAAQDVDLSAAQGCIDIEDRLIRLQCYDDALGRENDTVEVRPSTLPLDKPESLKFAEQVLVSTQETAEGTKIALFDRAIGEVVPYGGSEELSDYLKSLSGSELDELQITHDYYFALPSDESIGEKAIMLFSCQRNITNFEVYFFEPFGTARPTVEFISSSRVGNPEGDIRVQFRTGADGFRLEAPRGIEGIRLIGRIGTPEKMQFVAPRGDQSASAFFDMSQISTARSLLGKYCSWLGYED